MYFQNITMVANRGGDCRVARALAPRNDEKLMRLRDAAVDPVLQLAPYRDTGARDDKER